MEKFKREIESANDSPPSSIKKEPKILESIFPIS
jgi:hypothetical protein